MAFLASTAWLFSDRHINSFQPASFSLQRQQNPHNFLSNEGNLLEAHSTGEVLPGAHGSAGWFHPDVLFFLFRSAGGIQSDAQLEARSRSEQRPEIRSNGSALCGLQTFQRSRETIVSMDTNGRRRSPSCVHKPLSVSDGIQLRDLNEPKKDNLKKKK